MSYRRSALPLLCFLLLFLLSPALKAEELTGPSFSDPDSQMSMPEKWQDKDILYHKDVANADLVINLDQSQYPFFAPVIKQYSKENDLNIFINSGTCGISSKMMINKEADITSFCCPPSNTDRIPGLKFHTMGITPLVLIINPQNPVRNVSLQEAQKAFMGEIHRWSELSHDPEAPAYDHPIHPIAFIHCKKRPGHWRLILDNEELFSIRLKTVSTIPEMILTVANNPMALGYEIPGLVDLYSKDQGAEVAFLKINGMDPLNLQHLVNGEYPFYRTYNLTVWEDAKKPEVGKLIKYLVDFVEKEGAKHQVVSAAELRKAGWQFRGDELIGEAK